jgi:ribosomal-protein-serine acetyltransferase
MKLVEFPKIIKTNRLYLRALQPSDANPLFNSINNQRGHIGRYLDWVENVKTLDDEKKFVAGRIEGAKNLNEFNWCIFKNSTNEFIGFIGTDPVSVEVFENGRYIDWKNRTVSFAYFLDESETGCGYMTEALSILKDIALSMGFRRIEINSEKENIKSQKVAERCGFVHDRADEGRMYFEKGAKQ